MTRTVPVRPLQKLDVTRTILAARKRLDDNPSRNKRANLSLGYYHMQALLEVRTSNGIYCYKCNSIISIGEPFVKSKGGGKPYHEYCARQLNII